MTFVDSWLARVGSRVRGALMSIAWHEPANDQPIVTGRVLLHESPIDPRPAVRYPSVRLEDRWIEREALILVVADLLRGEAGEFFPCVFRRPNAEQVYTIDDLHSNSGWAEVLLTWDVEAGRRDPEWLPAVAPGERPFRTWAEAAADWVFGQQATYSNDVPHQARLVFVMPDRRGRVTCVRVDENGLQVECEIGTAPNEFELQFAFSRGRRRLEAGTTRIGGNGVSRIPMVPTASTLDLFVVSKEQGLISHACFSGSSLPLAQSDLPARAAEEDLAGGENDRVEFKPFIRRDDAKVQDLARSIIAFANTEGGRLYIGVDDDGSPQEHSKLYEAFKTPPADAIVLAEKEVKKLVRERITPVPSIETAPMVIRGCHVLRVQVAPGDAIYATHTGNDVWIRRGATIRRPSPSEFAALLTERTRSDAGDHFAGEDIW